MRPRHRKEKKAQYRENKRGIYLLPNLFTSAGLFCGFFAIIAAIQQRFEPAAAAILISCLFDALDGKIARYTRTTSHFGKEYDSLSDLVAFGVAPGILAFQWALSSFGRLGWLAAFTYVICGALRLARFNVQKDTGQSKFFKGLPIPGAAAFISSFILFTGVFGGLPESFHFLALIIVYALSFFMVSTLDYVSFKQVEIRKQKPFNVLVGIILVLIVVAYRPRLVLFPILLAYLISGPVISGLRLRKKGTQLLTPGFASPANNEEIEKAIPNDLTK